MTIRELIPVLNARVLCGDDMLDQEVKTACGSDLMSDVLAFVKDKTVLITGLTNVHVMRTARRFSTRHGSLASWCWPRSTPPIPPAG